MMYTAYKLNKQGGNIQYKQHLTEFGVNNFRKLTFLSSDSQKKGQSAGQKKYLENLWL